MSWDTVRVGDWYVKAYHAPWQPWTIALMLMNRAQEKRIIIADLDARHETARFVELDPNDGSPPTLTLTRENAQKLMDSLWDCGLRPVGGAGSAGQLEATHKHLADMRALVAHFSKARLA